MCYFPSHIDGISFWPSNLNDLTTWSKIFRSKLLIVFYQTKDPYPTDGDGYHTTSTGGVGRVRIGGG